MRADHIQARHEPVCLRKFPDCPCNTCIWDRFVEQLPNGRPRITPCCQGRACTSEEPCPHYQKERTPEAAPAEQGEEQYGESYEQ